VGAERNPSHAFLDFCPTHASTIKSASQAKESLKKHVTLETLI